MKKVQEARVGGPRVPDKFFKEILFKHTNFGLMKIFIHHNNGSNNEQINNKHGPFQNLRKWIYCMRVATQTRVQNIQTPTKSAA